MAIDITVFSCYSSLCTLNPHSNHRPGLFRSDSRLAAAQTTSTFATSSANCWAETYKYDPWGNLYKLGADTTTQSAYTGCTQESGFDFSNFIGNNNRITISGYGYDAAGNMTAAPPTGTTYTYNAENQLVSTAGVTYTYDGDGKRVMKSGGTIYWYGGGSDTLEETDLAGAFKFRHYYFNGQRLARREANNWVDHYALDHLGNARWVYGNNGAWDVSDFYPFGGERIIQSNAGNRFKFTGKERDSESGLDNFGARFDSSTLGRFMSPDWSASPEAAPYAKLDDPQSLNLYTYSRNNPVNLTDPDGHCWHWAEKLCNFWNYGVFKTNVELGKMIAARRQWLIKNEVTVNGKTPEDFKTADARTIWNSFNNAQLYIMEAMDGTTPPGISPVPVTISVLPLPPGFNQAQFGQDLMKWGTGDQAALDRMKTITREELEKAGVTKEMAKQWRDFYDAVKSQNPSNPSAAGRAELMQHVYKLLGGQ